MGNESQYSEIKYDVSHDDINKENEIINLEKECDDNEISIIKEEIKIKSEKSHTISSNSSDSNKSNKSKSKQEEDIKINPEIISNIDIERNLTNDINKENEIINLEKEYDDNEISSTKEKIKS